MNDPFAHLPLPRQPADPAELPFAEPLTERERGLSLQLDWCASVLDSHAALAPAMQAQVDVSLVRGWKRVLERTADL